MKAEKRQSKGNGDDEDDEVGYSMMMGYLHGRQRGFHSFSWLDDS